MTRKSLRYTTEGALINIYLVQYKVFDQEQPPEVFYKKAALKSFAIFTGKPQCWSLFLIKRLFLK